jgi:hypothetical protein
VKRSWLLMYMAEMACEAIEAFPAQCASIPGGSDNALITTGECQSLQSLVIARLSFTVLLPMSSRARV